MDVLERALAQALGNRVAEQPLGGPAQELNLAGRIDEDDGVRAVFDQRLKQVTRRRRARRGGVGGVRDR
jgi:hypothetical protein